MGKSILALYASYKQLVLLHGTRGVHGDELRYSSHFHVQARLNGGAPWDVPGAFQRAYSKFRGTARRFVRRLREVHRPFAAGIADDASSREPHCKQQACTQAPSRQLDEVLQSSPYLRAAVLGVLGNGAKLWMTHLNRTTVIAAENIKAITDRSPGTPVITVCNHVAALDDPFVLAAILPSGYKFSQKGDDLRWTFCATDRCFKYGSWLSSLFRAGKVLPIERGAGVEQRGMQAAVDRLSHGEWVHIFPEGTRGRDSSSIQRVRRGIGYLVSSSVFAPTADNGPRPPAPLVVPFVHSGMENVLPRGKMLPRVGQNVTVLIGKPISMDDLLDDAALEGWSRRALDDAIAARVEQHMRALHRQLQDIVELLHESDMTQTRPSVVGAAPELEAAYNAPAPQLCSRSPFDVANEPMASTSGRETLGNALLNLRMRACTLLLRDSDACQQQAGGVLSRSEGLGFGTYAPKRLREIVSHWETYRAQQQLKLIQMLWPNVGASSDNATCGALVASPRLA